MRYTKKDLYDRFDQRISKKCIKHDGCEWGITGKYCRITPMDGKYWDLWLCNPKDIAKGLGTRRLSRIISILSAKMLPGKPFTELTGEAYTQVATKDLILGNLSLLGINRKRIVSEQTRQASADRLARLRAA